MKKIAISLSMIAFVAMMAVGATGAYFTDSKTVGVNVFSTGTVKIGSTYNMPITMEGLTPGAEASTGVLAIDYAGTLKGDLYYGFKSVPGGYDFGPVLSIKVARVDSVGNVIQWINSDWVPSVFPYENFTKIATGLSQNERAYYKVWVKMAADANNDYQGKVAYNSFVLSAVQEGGPAPVAP